MKNDLKLKAIIEEMCHKGGLPALHQNVHEITRLSRQISTCASDLAAVVMRDCGLTSNLLSTANSAYYSPVAPIKTVSAAVIYLGFEKVQALALGLTIFTQAVKSAHNQRLAKLYASSYFTGSFSMALAKLVKYPNPEEIFVAGLLYRLPQMAIAHNFPKQSLMIEKLIVNEQIPYNKATLKVLGVEYDDLCRAIQALYEIPGTISRILYQDSSKDLMIALIHQADAITNMLFGYLPGGKQAISETEMRLADLMKRKSFSVGSFIKQSFRDDPNVKVFFNLKEEDVNMMVNILEWGKASPAQVIENMTFGERVEDARDLFPENREQLIGHFLNELSVCRRHENDINQILMLAQEVLYRCFPNAEIFMCLLDQRDSIVQGRHYTGESLVTNAEEFRVPMKQVESPITDAIIERKTFLWRLGQRPLCLPPILIQRLQCKTALIVPIQVSNEAVGVYFLGRKAKNSFSEKEVDWVESIAEQVQLALEQARKK